MSWSDWIGMVITGVGAIGCWELGKWWGRR
jgi:hypothetical protein